MSYGVQVEIWGDYALFSRPEFKVERVSYDIMTPSAARGILESIYWHPGMKWIVDKIYVLSPIEFTSIRRNEVKSKISANNVFRVMKGGNKKLYIATANDIQQRSSLVLKNVHYVINAHFILTEQANTSDNNGKFQDIIKRRLEKGQCYSMPYLGCREFPAHFRSYEFENILTAYNNIEKDLGFMLYDMDYSDPHDITPMFFRGVLKDGILDLTECEVHK